MAVGAVAVAAVALTMKAAGLPQPPLAGIPDAGGFVEWAVPLVGAFGTLAASCTVGLLLTSLFLLPSGERLEGLSVRGVQLAGRWAWAWAVLTCASGVLQTADIFGKPLDNLDFALLWSYVSGFAPGFGLVVEFICAVYVAISCRWTLAPHTLSITLGIAVAAVTPPAMAGHAAAAGAHALAVPALLLHVVGITVWVGGLIGLAWVALRGSKRLEPAIRRYSALALWAFVVVAISGIVSAAVRIGSVSGLNSTYGGIVVAKAVLLLLLGVFGVLQRRRIAQGSGGFVRLAVTEILVMATAISVGVVLSRTATPLGDDVLTSAGEKLLGTRLPPAPTVHGVLFSVNPNGFGLAIVGFGVALYVLGLRILHRRGDAWPIGRTISWFFGLVLVAWATFGGLGTWSSVMFSIHMMSHMILAMVAPIFLTLGAPMTLALRTLPGPRQPGENSPRSTVNWLLHSWIGRLYTNPILVALNFVGSLYVVYFSNLFGVLMRSHWGHMFMELHFLVSGLLFFYVIIGVDPSPRRLHPFTRMGLLLITIPVHAFFAVALMSKTTVIAEDYYRLLDRPYATNLLHDQYVGAGFTWGIAEVPTLIVVLALFVQWWRQDRREAARYDRTASRDNDAELEKYNAYLQALQESDQNST